MSSLVKSISRRQLAWAMAGVALAAIGCYYWSMNAPAPKGPAKKQLHYKPSQFLDTSGFLVVQNTMSPWRENATLEELAAAFDKVGYKILAVMDRRLSQGGMTPYSELHHLIAKAQLLSFEGDPKGAYDALTRARALVEADDELAQDYLYTLISFQGIVCLRRGEDENCILCRGESSCILPISAAAVHVNPEGSRLAVKHFTEYLEQFPDDLGMRWLLNLAHMTLGEHPHGVAPAHLLRIDSWIKSEFDIGRFRDIGDKVGINRLNQGGGMILEDFDNDGLLDLAFTSFDACASMAYYRNRGDGTFEERTQAAGLLGQKGGLNCVQTDYNNDGHMDIFIPRGAWHMHPMRPSLLRNNGNGTFTDVTREAGLLVPVNSISASWADYDNDGFLDLFVCADHQPSRLYRNMGNETFKDVTAKAGLAGEARHIKAAVWIDADNDGWPELFLNGMDRTPPRLFRNNRNGSFTDVTTAMGLAGPDYRGFSSWAFDFDNDGYLDIFAHSYERDLGDAVKGLLGQPHDRPPSKVLRNLGGKGFQDVNKEVGLDQIYIAMGSNFADFDNDGFLDIYFGTGAPHLGMLVPNRMLKNVGGKRFADITGSSGAGHLQKGHGVACGDWTRDGNIDLFISMGGVINGDKYHNILFQNPRVHGNNSLTVKLIGKKTNRAAIGARIKVVTAGDHPLTVHRHVSSGSSFGANPLEQTIGVGKAEKIALLEIHWPTSGTTQTFRDVAVNQFIKVTEFAAEFERVNVKRVPLPPTDEISPRSATGG